MNPVIKNSIFVILIFGIVAFCFGIPNKTAAFFATLCAEAIFLLGVKVGVDL